MTYQELRENGICVRCKKRKAVEGKCRCNSCREKQRIYVNETRKFLQENVRICPRCKKNRLYGEEKVCLECGAYEYKVTMESRKRKGREHYNKLHADWERREHKKRIENGICTRCGKRKADNGFKTCGICRAKNREQKRKNRTTENRNERYERGVCYFCENPIKEGYKVCEKHYEMNLKKLQHPNCQVAREEIKRKNKIFFKKI